MAVVTKDGPEFHDVFISHSFEDKAEFVEPLVVALQAAGLTCWYDSLQMKSGDSITASLNDGLTHSKVVLFCVTEGFLGKIRRGRWSARELGAAVGMSTRDRKHVRLLPLMLADPEAVRRAAPIPFAELSYVVWDPSDLKRVTDAVRKRVEEINSIDASAWADETRSAWAAGDFPRVAVNARIWLDHAPRSLGASTYTIAAELKRDRVPEALQFAIAKENEPEPIDEDLLPVDEDITEFVQASLSALAVEGKVPQESSRAVLGFLMTGANRGRAWKHMAQLLDLPEFRWKRDELAPMVLALGEGAAIDWTDEVASRHHEYRVRKSVASVLPVLCSRVPERLDSLLQIATRLLNDKHEEVRQDVLAAVYFFHPQGSRILLDRLNDRASNVRGAAFELLSGAVKLEIDENGYPKANELDGVTDPALKAEHVLHMLRDPDDLTVETVIDALSDERVPLPADEDLEHLVAEGRGIPEMRIVALSRAGDDDAGVAGLLEIARTDPVESVREAAVERLRTASAAVPADALRELYELENVHSVREKLHELLATRPETPIDVRLAILRETVPDELATGLDDLLRGIAASGDREALRSAFGILLSHKRVKLLVKHAVLLAQAGLTLEISMLAEAIVRKGTVTARDALVLGLASAVPDSLLEQLTTNTAPDVRVSALRGLESRRRDGRALQRLIESYETMRPAVAAGENQALWASLSIIDGILESGDRQLAVKLLHDYYDEVRRALGENSYPLRAAFDRLRVLGEPVEHPVYSADEPSQPYPWPTAHGPFFGMRNQ